MKKKIVLTVWSLVIFAATSFSQGVHVGIKAGTDIHKMKGKSFDEEYKLGYHAGAFVTIKLGNLGLQPEVYFSQVNIRRGANVNSVFNLNNIREATLSYVNIPILLNVKFSKNVVFQLGPQYGILVNQDNSAVQNGKDAFKKGDFSLNGGLQVKISKFRVYGRYNVGLNDVNDISDTEKWKNQTIHVGVGFAIL